MASRFIVNSNRPSWARDRQFELATSPLT